MKRELGLREYLDLLEGEGELVRVTRRVDPHLEMAAIARLGYETGAPASLFDDVAEAAAGMRAVGGLIGTSARPDRELTRVAMALGLSADASAHDVVEAFYEARRATPIPPKVVPTGPCKENILLGDDVDILTLPLPYLHDGDGGRYLNTFGVIVARTPDGRWTNWSIARIMAVDERTGTGQMVPVQHLGRVHHAWREAGQDMPFALALGVDPTVAYAAGMPLPSHFDEADFVGALTGEPVEVVRCETNELLVPADAEIVIEGRLSISDLEVEGPIGEYAGYIYPFHGLPQPVYRIDAMTHRDNPVYPFVCSGEGPDENHTVWGLSCAGEQVYQLREAGIPVTTAWVPFASANGWLAVTVPPQWRDVDASAVDFCRRVAEVVFSVKAADVTNTLIVLEDDIDPSDLSELVWAIDGRCARDETGQLRIEDRLYWPMAPHIDTKNFDYPAGWRAPRNIWNCLPDAYAKPYKRTSFSINYPSEVQERVLSHWEDDGFPAVHDLRRRGRSDPSGDAP